MEMFYTLMCHPKDVLNSSAFLKIYSDTFYGL
jgi:hypothetical protein